MKRYISWEDLSEARHSLITHMLRDQWCPELVVGLSRGGLPLATMLSHSLDVPMAVITLSLRDNSQSGIDLGNVESIQRYLDLGKQVLVVDDINDSGATLSGVSEILESHSDPSTQNLRYATMLSKESSSAEVDYTWLTVAPDIDHIWWVFPWEH